jgi:hypothetical protein
MFYMHLFVIYVVYVKCTVHKVLGLYCCYFCFFLCTFTILLEDFVLSVAFKT